MKNKDLIKYLKTFPEDADFNIILANPRKRKRYDHNEIMLLKDDEINMPVLCIAVGNEVDMDAEEVKVCKERENISGQMEIEDYPEVMP